MGERLLLLGPTGSGKSTLLRLLMGIVPHLVAGELTGDLAVAGHDVRATPPRGLAAAGVAMVAQDPAETFVADRVGGEVAFGPEGLDLTVAEVDRRVADALAAVGLSDAPRRRVRELSGGEQQRVAIASALAMQPRILLLDEPTAHLDDPTAREILALIDRIARERAMTIVLAEHRLAAAAALATHAVVLAGGAVARTGSPRDVLGDERVADLGVPVPRAAVAARAIGIPAPLPLTPDELARRLRPVPAEEAAPAAVGAVNARIVVRCDTVTYSYPAASRPAVREVSFEIGTGERVALVGPTGSGKSTLARLLLGLRRPRQGRVELAGMRTDTTPIARLARAGGLVLQDPVRQLIADTVRDEIALGLGHLAPGDAAATVSEALHRGGLADLATRHPLTLSEGERRRVVLAAALARRPAVLVLDEPTLGQDAHQRDALTAHLRELADGGMAVVVITHDPEAVNDLCDRALLLREGALVADLRLGGAPEDVAAAAAAGLPLADVPATVLALAGRGAHVVARTTGELAAGVRTPEEVT